MNRKSAMYSEFINYSADIKHEINESPSLQNLIKVIYLIHIIKNMSVLSTAQGRILLSIYMGRYKVVTTSVACILRNI